MDNFNRFIDYALLKSDASFEDIEKLCLDAVEYNFKYRQNRQEKNCGSYTPE